MQAASLVEGILRRVTTKDRATAIVGDLVETREQKGAVWFWLSSAGVMLSLVWRWAIAFVASFFAGSWSAYAFVMATTGFHAPHRPPDYPWGPVVEGIGLAGCSAIALGVYAAIQYGLRECATQMVLAWATVAAAVIYLWWAPAALVFCIAGAAGLAFYSVFAREGRWASVVVWPAMVVGVAGFFFVGGIDAFYQHLLKPGPWGSDDMLRHPSVPWLAFSLMLCAHLAKVCMWSRMRGWAAEARRAGSEAIAE